MVPIQSGCETQNNVELSYTEKDLCFPGVDRRDNPSIFNIPLELEQQIGWCQEGGR